jgi:hypothetical protein
MGVLGPAGKCLRLGRDFGATAHSYEQASTVAGVEAVESSDGHGSELRHVRWHVERPVRGIGSQDKPLWYSQQSFLGHKGECLDTNDGRMDEAGILGGERPILNGPLAIKDCLDSSYPSY